MRRSLALGLALAFGLGCVAPPPTSGEPARQPSPTTTATKASPAQAERLSRLMVPLLKAMDNGAADKFKWAIKDPQITLERGAGLLRTPFALALRTPAAAAVLAHEISPRSQPTSQGALLAAGVGTERC